MKLIDITHPVTNATPVFPGEQPVEITQRKFLDADMYNGCVVTSNLHTGTHIDMPMHLSADPRTVLDFPLEGFIGRGMLLDVRGEDVISMKPEYRDLNFDGAVVLLYTGFDELFTAAPERYFNAHPVVGEELGDFLLSQSIKILGLDTCSPDRCPWTFHKTLLAKGVFVLENAANLGALLGIANFEVMAFPLKIAAEASMIRAVCRVN